MLDQYYFPLTVLHNIFHNVFACMVYHFTCLPIMEGDIMRIINYDYDKYFSISAWVKSVGSCDAKVKGKKQNSKEK